MAVTAEQVSVGTTAVALNAAANTGLSLVLRAGTTGVFVGPSGVTTTNGLELSSGTPLAIDLDPGDVLYAVHASSATVHVLRT